MKHTSSWALRRVIKSLGRYLPLLLVSLLLAAASVAGTLYIPILVGDAIDQIVGPGQVNFAAVGNLAVKIAVLAGLTAVLQWVMTAIHNRVCFCVTRDVRRQAFSHLQRLPLAYLDSHPSGDTLSRMIADVDQFADGLLMGFTQFFTGVLTIVGTLLFMLWMNPLITLVVVVITPVSLFVASFIARKTYAMFKEQSAARGVRGAGIVPQNVKPGPEKRFLYAFPEDRKVVGIYADADAVQGLRSGALTEIPVHRRGLPVAHGGDHGGHGAAGDGPQALLQPLGYVNGVQIPLRFWHPAYLQRCILPQIPARPILRLL